MWPVYAVNESLVRERKMLQSTVTIFSPYFESLLPFLYYDCIQSKSWFWFNRRNVPLVRVFICKSQHNWNWGNLFQASLRVRSPNLDREHVLIIGAVTRPKTMILKTRPKIEVIDNSSRSCHRTNLQPIIWIWEQRFGYRFSFSLHRRYEVHGR